jgi:hypothetical protein
LIVQTALFVAQIWARLYCHLHATVQNARGLVIAVIVFNVLQTRWASKILFQQQNLFGVETSFQEHKYGIKNE